MAEAVAPAGRDVPLCVDLDGTLVRSDTLHENLLAVARTKPLALLSLPRWLSEGKAAMKQHVGAVARIDAALLPYRDTVLDLIAQARAEGRKVILATAATANVAHAVADHVGLFDEVLCSSDSLNLSSHRKAEMLADRFGAGGFDYVGNHWDDVAVFAQARRVYLVSTGGRLLKAVQRRHPDATMLTEPAARPKVWLKAIRAHQWVKNVLVFIPLAAAGPLTDPRLLGLAICAFVAFSLFASSIYILNDLIDLEPDRLHRTKCKRPFASGRLSVATGIALIPLMLLASVTLSVLFLPPIFLLCLCIYGVMTAAYTFRLKRQIVMDVIILAGLYTSRILAGAAATSIKPSFWLLAFSMFIFLCLAMVKRFSELRLAVERETTLSGRGYMASDLPVVLSLGSASGMVSVLILALYTQSEIVPKNYPAAEWLWLVPPLMLYWVSRLWMKANRGEVDDDPVVFAVRDWQSLVIVAIMGLLFVLARIGFLPL